ncbi:MAG: transposase [Candidatus Sumerlaeota bacterium]|nr:transposase [Candidatus Sumerlaeota bacterium]
MKTSTRYQPWEPDQSTFLPPNPREWLPEDHLVYFLLDLVEELDLRAMAAAYSNEHGGRAPYDVRMMALLLLYAYCVGVPDSRRIERATYESLPFRVLTADQHPDHDTIAAFRHGHLEALKGLFVQVLRLCRAAGLAPLGARGAGWDEGPGQRLQAQGRKLRSDGGEAARVYQEFLYKTQKSWTKARRVVAKAGFLAKGPNPRFVVTSLSAQAHAACALYEQVYCARGDMENRIKEQQSDMFADRVSATEFRANQVRLWFSAVAYVVMTALRRGALRGTDLARAQCSTIRVRLLKIGAAIRLSVRRIRISLAEAFPLQAVFAAAWRRLQDLPWRGEQGPASRRC